MAIPANLTTITVTGTYVDPAGNAIAGTVSFTAPADICDAAGPGVIPPVPNTQTLSAGSFSVVLVCTDNAALSPTGWAYTYTETFTALGYSKTYSIPLPHTLGSTVDISALIPTSTVPTPAPNVYGVLAQANTWTALNTFTNSVAISGSANGELTVTGTATGQQLIAAVGADSTTIGYQSRVSTDSINRFTLGVDGAMHWGPGGSTARDTDLYRGGVGQLNTDGAMYIAGAATVAGALTASTNLAVGGAGSYGGGAGVLSLLNAATPPGSAPSGGVVIYAQGGILRYENPQGLIQTMVGSQAGATSAVTVANSGAASALATLTVPAADAVAGAVYRVVAWGYYSTTGTPTLTFAGKWGGASGTALATVPAITTGSGVSNCLWFAELLVTILSSTTATAVLQLMLGTSASTDAASLFVAVPTAAVTIATNTSNALVLAVTWSTGSPSNTITAASSYTERVA